MPDNTKTLSAPAKPLLAPETEGPLNHPNPAIDSEIIQAEPNPKGGPRTAEGKARSALNNLRHGLAGSFRIIDHESQEKFESLLAALRDEHQPATATEELLIQRMAEHFWLSRRAQQLQDTAALLNIPSNFALMLRYQALHDRGFHKCLTELRKLKKERAQQDQAEQIENKKQFESQSAAQSDSNEPEFESHKSELPEEVRHSHLISGLRTLLGESWPASDDPNRHKIGNKPAVTGSQGCL